MPGRMTRTLQVGFVVVHGWHKRIIMHGPAIAKYYLCHGTAIIDVFSVTPFIAQVPAPMRRPWPAITQRHTSSIVLGVTMVIACPGAVQSSVERVPSNHRDMQRLHMGSHRSCPSCLAPALSLLPTGPERYSLY